jgi:hypothetical protein
LKTRRLLVKSGGLATLADTNSSINEVPDEGVQTSVVANTNYFQTHTFPGDYLFSLLI